MTYPLRGCYWLIVFAFLCKAFFLAASDAPPTVLVSVAPHKCFVEKIAKGTVQVLLMVPAGASSHTYEPTPKQMIAAGRAALWFRIGEPFEDRALQALTSHYPKLKIVDLRHGLDLIQTQSECGCCPGSVDLHFWLSPREGQIQAKHIADVLMKTYPEHGEFYRANLHAFLKELQELDETIQTVLEASHQKFILVSHPAYAYFCRDYGLEQLAIEVEGKDPSPQQMTKLLNTARQLRMKKIFVQMQYNNKAAKLVADTMGAKLIVLDPYSEHYVASMLEIAHAIARP